MISPVFWQALALDKAAARLADAPFDERITVVVRLLSDALGSEFRREFVKSAVIDEVVSRIKLQKDELLVQILIK